MTGSAHGIAEPHPGCRHTRLCVYDDLKRTLRGSDVTRRRVHVSEKKVHCVRVTVERERAFQIPNRGIRLAWLGNAAEQLQRLDMIGLFTQDVAADARRRRAISQLYGATGLFDIGFTGHARIPLLGDPSIGTLSRM